MTTTTVEAVTVTPVIAHTPWWRGKLVQVAGNRGTHVPGLSGVEARVPVAERPGRGTN